MSAWWDIYVDGQWFGRVWSATAAYETEVVIGSRAQAIWHAHLAEGDEDR